MFVCSNRYSQWWNKDLIWSAAIFSPSFAVRPARLSISAFALFIPGSERLPCA